MPLFKDKRTAAIFNGEPDRRLPPDLRIRAEAALFRVVSANQLNDLLVPRSLRLEALQGDRLGTHSIRINRQWRVRFRWTDGGAEDIEIVDYH